MIDEICNSCLFKKPDERCENYVKRMVGECRWPDAIKIMKFGAVRYKIADDTFYPVKTPDWLIMDLDNISRAKERVHIHIVDPQQKFDQIKDYWFKSENVTEANVPALKEVKWTGYVRKSEGPMKKPMLFTYKNSKKGREIPILNIICMEWCRNKRGRDMKMCPPKQPVF